jgi:hypothetical protein
MVVTMTPWDVPVFGLGVKMARYNVSMEHGDHLKFKSCDFRWLISNLNSK